MQSVAGSELACIAIPLTRGPSPAASLTKEKNHNTRPLASLSAPGSPQRHPPSPSSCLNLPTVVSDCCLQSPTLHPLHPVWVERVSPRDGISVETSSVA